MKKIITLIMTLAVAFGMTACGNAPAENSAETKSETVTVKALNGDKEMTDIEVPYNPQRIAVLDMPALDIIDALGLGDRVVGSAKVTIDYLEEYNPDSSNGAIMNLGTVKTADFEKVAACEPDVIFIGGRLASVYKDMEMIAPVVYLAVDYEKGVVESTKSNVQTIATIFGAEAEAEMLFNDFQPRIEALKAVIGGKNAVLGMYNSNALALMGTASQLNLISNELGANNLSDTVGESEKATHGEEASWETVITLNPEYMFILDRSTATGTADEGVMGVREVIENELIKELDVYKNGKIIYFVENADVWYTATGGVQALSTMLKDLESALIK